MPKFTELDPSQRTALTSFYLEIVKIKAQEDRDLNSLGIRMLFVANAAGLAAMVSFIGNLINSGKGPHAFIPSLIAFIVGAICASLVQIIAMSVTSQGMGEVGLQLEQFFKDRLDADQIRNYTLTDRGRFFTVLFLCTSAGFFIYGVISAYSGLLSMISK